MIIDTFIYFNEIETLKVRINYLKNKVDKFIIYEFNQSFSGKKKEFNFEKIFSNYNEKIVYQKIDINFKSINEIRSFLERKSDDRVENAILQKINLLIFNNDNFYDKDHFTWILQAFQKNYIYLILHRLNLSDEDIILISDLDEIPSLNSFQLYEKLNLTKIYSYKLYEFKFYFNLMHPEKRFGGSLLSTFLTFKNHPINIQQLKWESANNIEKNVEFFDELIGYHFSEIYPIELLIEKRKSSSHQEFNNQFVIKNMKKRVNQGRTYYPSSSNFFKTIKFILVDTNNREIFDEFISKEINQHKDYIKEKLENCSIIFDIYYSIVVYVNVKLFWYKLKLSKFFK